MYKIDWDKFRVKNEDQRKSFEELSYYLFCRKYKRSVGVFRYNNQTGIETEPIKHKGKIVGFQSKWFEATIDKEQIITSITRAKAKNPKLNKIVLYINKSFTESSKKGQKDGQLKIDIEKHAKVEKISIEWIVPSNFQVLLNQPTNLDLAQLYFDVSDEFGFIKAFSNPEILTFLQSSEYIDLPFFNLKTEKIEDIIDQILKLKQKVLLISGHPGSGKSISIYRIFQTLSGLDKGSLEDSRNVLQNNKGVPMLINLKDCAFETVENIIRNRQNDYKLRNSKLNFIYLFDGLDELSAEKADHVLSYLYELEKNETSLKIIISCRSGNLNKVKVKTYFNEITEYKIHDLTDAHLSRYFLGKTILDKKKLLASFRKKNPRLLVEIKDILLVKLLWDTIESLDEHATILDLLDKKIELLVSDPRYKKNIDELNLLNPKESKIIELNKELSYKFQKKFQFRLPQNEIHEIILSKYPRLDYKDANEVLSYLANLFFDGYSSTPPNSPENPPSFVYQHRRYQDYFFIQYLADVYDQNPRIIRELNVLSNRDFFENLFLAYLRKKYTKDRNLPGVLGLNLIEVYLGNRNDYGADDPFYQNSTEFMPSLARQDQDVFEGLLTDESLDIRKKISIDLEEIKDKFSKWEKDKSNWRLKDYLIGVWNGGIPFLLQNMTILWRFGQKAESNELRKILNEILSLFKKHKFEENLKENDRLSNPFWARWEEHLYLRIVFKIETPKSVFETLIRANYKNFSDERYTIGRQEEGKDKLVKSFFRVLVILDIKYLSEIIPILDEEEILMLIDVLVSENNLPLLIKDKSISQKIKSKVQSINSNNIKLVFCRKVLNLELSESERNFTEETFKKLRESRPVDWHMDNTPLEYSLVAYILEKTSFDEYLKPQEGHPFRYYDELGLYSALFRDYVDLLKSSKKIESISRDYIRYINFYFETVGGKYLKVDMSFLWATIFSNAKVDLQKLKDIKGILITNENNLIPFSFYFRLQKINEKLFVKLIDRNDLQSFEKHLDNWDDDSPSYVNRCFELASFFAQIDKQKAIRYIAKGINEGMVRHGWHKDIIVSHFLIDALEILWRNNWASREELRILSENVFKLTIKVKQITDGDHTSRGPFTLIDMVAKYDLEYATKLKEDIDRDYSERRYSSNITLSSILKSKISRGIPIEELEEEIKRYRKDYRYDGKTDPDYYEQKFEIYLLIAQSDFYSSEEKKKAFESAYEQIEEIKKEEIDYYLADWEYKSLKKTFVKLCKKYRKKVNVAFEKKDEYRREIKVTEKAFLQDLREAKTKQKMIALLKKVNDQVELNDNKSWNLIVEKTHQIFGNIKPFIELLRDNSYPHTDWLRLNSQHFHFGLAAAINNVNTKEETLNYLFDKTTGHGGYVNVMKSYEVNGDREMCLKLFRYFLRMCDFLVN